MASSKALLFAAANAATACSFVYDTSDLRGEGGTGGTGGDTTTSTSTGGGVGGEAVGCACEPRPDVVWLLVAEGAAVSDAAPACPEGRSLAEGGLTGSLQDETSSCGGPCTGPSRVKLTIDDTCGVSGDGVSNTGSCDAKTLSPETPGDTSLAINLEPLPCTLSSPPLVDAATVTRASACAVEDDCAAPPNARRCVPASAGACPDPCFGEPTSVATIVDERDCDGVLATCSPPVFGELELHDDAACNGSPTASWTISGAAICPASPTPPVSPNPSYWRYTPSLEVCNATAIANGTVSLTDTLIELCCAPAGR